MVISSRTQLVQKYAWFTSPKLSEPVLDILLTAADAIQSWLEIPANQDRKPSGLFHRLFRETVWKPSNFIWRNAGFHHVEFQTVFLDPSAVTVETAVHEFAHVLDNSFSSHGMASVFGGGAADEMIGSIGSNPDLFLPRFFAPVYEKTLRAQHVELNPTVYGRTRGPSEDFAEGFRLAVLHSQLLFSAAPRRYEWFAEWRTRLITSVY